MKKTLKRVLTLAACTVVSFGGVICQQLTYENEITLSENEYYHNAEVTVYTSNAKETDNKKKLTYDCFSLSDVPAYSRKAYTEVNNNVPFFYKSELSTESFEKYSEMDRLGRCGSAFACIGKDIMPTDECGTIGNIKPTGWHTVKYDNVEGKYLYNRCHLIGYQLSGENANENNLITGTRYLNVEGMKRFEDKTANYVNETGNHVLYRVTPMFTGNDLLAKGVLMEGYSVEDNGSGVCFNVFCYNVQPGIKLFYSNGNSEKNVSVSEKKEQVPSNTKNVGTHNKTYILNTNTKKFHIPSCSSVKQIREKNKKTYTGNRKDVISQGYSPCKKCDP